MKDYEEYITSETTWLSQAWATEIIKQGKDKDTRIKIWRVLEGLQVEPYGSSAYIYEQKNFKKLEEIASFLETAGIALELMVVTDNPDARMKQLRVKMPSEDNFSIYVYLAQQADCELIEVSREAQPDKITYEMRCNEAIENEHDS